MTVFTHVAFATLIVLVPTQSVGTPMPTLRVGTGREASRLHSHAKRGNEYI